MTLTNALPAYRHARRGMGLLVLTLLVLLALSACSDQRPSDEVHDTPSARTNATVSAAGTEVDTVEVIITEYAIEMPTSLSEGPTVFMVANTGAEPHSFLIERQGMVDVLEGNLMPGDTLSLRVDLHPGTYLVNCPIAGHEAFDASLELQVSGSDVGTS